MISDHISSNVNEQWQYVHEYYNRNCLLPPYFQFNFHYEFIVLHEIGSRTIKVKVLNVTR